MESLTPTPLNYDRFDPRRRRQLSDIGMWLFLGALGTLFGAGMLGYVLIRTRVFGEGSLGAVHIQLPEILWLSTAVIVTASYTIHRAVLAVSHEKQAAFRKWLVATLVLGAAFVIIQIPALTILLQDHFRMLGETVANGRRHNALYGFIFSLIALHALHVIGGIVSLVWMGINGLRGKYDHENYGAVRYTAMYWHFLDIVWIVLFVVIWALA